LRIPERLNLELVPGSGRTDDFPDLLLVEEPLDQLAVRALLPPHELGPKKILRLVLVHAPMMPLLLGQCSGMTPEQWPQPGLIEKRATDGLRREFSPARPPGLGGGHCALGLVDAVAHEPCGGGPVQGYEG